LGVGDHRCWRRGISLVVDTLEVYTPLRGAAWEGGVPGRTSASASATPSARREELGLTQEDLAGGAGIHRTYLSDVEPGERNVSILNLRTIARALRVPQPSCWPTVQVPARDLDDGLVATDTPDAVSGYPAERVSEALPQIILM
jgi:transcriptional regulator with XRE-family HTH domain